MATHSSILAWRIQWTEKPGGLQSVGLQSRTRCNDCTTYPAAISLYQPGWGLSTKEAAVPTDDGLRRVMVKVRERVCRLQRTFPGRPRRVKWEAPPLAGLGTAEAGWAGACLSAMSPLGIRRRGQRWERRRTLTALIIYACVQWVEHLWAWVSWPVLLVPSVSKCKDFFFKALWSL